MGWDGTIKPPSSHRNRIEEREKGSKEREAPQNNCVLYLFHFHPVGESRWEKEREKEIGEDAARGGIRNSGGRQAQ